MSDDRKSIGEGLWDAALEAYGDVEIANRILAKNTAMRLAWHVHPETMLELDSLPRHQAPEWDSHEGGAWVWAGLRVVVTTAARPGWLGVIDETSVDRGDQREDE